MLSFKSTPKDSGAESGDVVTIGAYWFRRAYANSERARRAEEILERFCDQLDESESEINRLREAEAIAAARPELNGAAAGRVRGRRHSRIQRPVLS